MAIDKNPRGFALDPDNPGQKLGQHANGVSMLEAPQSISWCIAIARMSDTPVLCLSAALGACWHGPGHLRKVKGGRANPTAYGQACEDELYDRGYSISDIAKGGDSALVLIKKRVPSSALATEHEENSSAGTESPA